MPTPPTTTDLLQPQQKPAQAAPPKRRILPFNDWARTFDPMMPKEDYEKQRDFYFNKYVAPHYKNNVDRALGQEKFNSLTQRKPLLTTGEKAMLPVSLGVSQFFAKAEESKIFGGTLEALLTDKGKASFEAQKTKDQAKATHLEQLAAREGFTTPAAIGSAAGSFAEMGTELASIGKGMDALGELAKGLDLVKAGTTTAKSMNFANRLLKGGPTFAVYEGLHDNQGLTHSFIDGTFIKGLAEGRLWTMAGTGKLVSRVLKGGVIGAGLGAAHAEKNQGGAGALVGGLTGAAFGLLPGEKEDHVSVKDKAIKQALTQGEKPLNPEVDKSLATSVVQSADKAVRENKPPEIHIDEDLRGVKLRMSTPDGQQHEIPISPYAEARALDQMQKVTMAGGKVDGIDYSTTHGDVLNRFLKLQKQIGQSSPEIDKAILQESKQPEIKPSPVDKHFLDLAEADRVVSTHKNLPKSSQLYPQLTGAKKLGKDAASQLKENVTWASNQIGETNNERKFLNYQLSTLINNRNLPFTNPQVNEQLRMLAYKPEVRDLIPPQFRSAFDTAVMQAPKGQTYETSFFKYKDSYKALAPLSPRRAPDELMEMSKIHNEIKQGPPVVDSPVAFERQRQAAALKEYQDAYQQSLAYPEIGEALPPNQRPAWDSSRQRYIEQQVKTKEAEAKAALSKPPDKVPVVVDPAVRALKAKWAANRWEDEEAARKGLPAPSSIANRESPENFELPDLEDVPVSEIDQIMQEEIEKKSRGIENPGVAEEFLRTGQWSKEGYAKKVFASTIQVSPAEEMDHLEMGVNAKIEDGVLKVYVPSHVIDREYSMAGAFYQPDKILGVLDNLGFKNHPTEITDYALQGKRLTDLMNGNLLAGPGNGMIVLPAENPVEHELHETIHHAMDHISGLNGYHPEQFGIGDASTRTMEQISKGMESVPAYGNDPRGLLNEEAFVHAATAVLKGNKQALYGMGLIDTSVRNVMSMVYEVTDKSLIKLRSRPDSQELRYVKDNLEAIHKASSPTVSYSLREAADRLGKNFYTDSEGRIVFSSSEGTFTFADKFEAFQHLLVQDASAEAPSWTMALEQMGVLTDNPTLARFSPPRSPIIREPSADSKSWQKIMTASDMARPLAPFVGDVQTKLDEAFQGMQHVPLMESVKAVDRAAHENSAWQDQQRKSFNEELQKFSSAKLHDVFNFLSMPAPAQRAEDIKYIPGQGFPKMDYKEPQAWKKMQGDYNMSQEEMGHIKTLYDKLRQLDAQQHLGIFDYFLRELPVLRANDFKPDLVYSELKDPRKMSTMQKGIVTGRLKPQDTHAGRFINFVLGATREKAIEKPLAEFNSTINLKDKNGNYVLGPLRDNFNRWGQYMNFQPDVTQRFVNNVTAGMQESILAQFKRMNKFLPEGHKLPEEFEYPGALINKLMTISYAADVGFRASAAIRDTIQPYLTSLPILGPKALARGMRKGLSAEGYDEAEKAGALLHGGNVTELYGDIYQEIPVGGRGLLDKGVQAAGKILYPSRLGHNIGRLFVYHGVNETAGEAITNLRAGKITPDKFINDTGLWFLSKPERSFYLTQVMDSQKVPTKKLDINGKVIWEDEYKNDKSELSKHIALDMVDRTLWAYRRGQQPGALRTGAGRIFGQYGMWPLNFGEYIRTIGARALEGGAIRNRALQAGAVWFAANLGTYELFDKAFGIDAGKWLFLSPAGFAGGPALQGVINALPAAAQVGSIALGQEGTTEGAKALHEELTEPLHLLPGSNWSRSMLGTINNPTYWNDDNTPTGAGWAKIFGFTSVNEKEREREQNYTTQQLLRKRSGFAPGKGDLFGDVE